MKKKNNNSQFIYSKEYNDMRFYSKARLLNMIEELKEQRKVLQGNISKYHDNFDISIKNGVGVVVTSLHGMEIELEHIDAKLEAALDIYKEKYEDNHVKNTIKKVAGGAAVIVMTACTISTIKSGINKAHKVKECKEFLGKNVEITLDDDFYDYKQEWVETNIDPNYFDEPGVYPSNVLIPEFEEHLSDMDPYERFDLAYDVVEKGPEHEVISIDQLFDTLLYYGFDFDTIEVALKDKSLLRDVKAHDYKKFVKDALEKYQNNKESERDSNFSVYTKRINNNN